MPIQVNNLQSVVLPDGHLTLLERVLDYGLERCGKGNAEVSVVLVDDEYIRELNRDYRGLDQTTDVLSFALLEPGAEAPPIIPEETSDPEALPELLGDIYISVPRAVEQAENYEHTLERELCFLGIHGLLHLLGYDHHETEETALMREMEEKILQEFDLGRDPKI